MINCLQGKRAEALPTQVTVDVNGVGYEVLIPLSSFDKLPQPGAEVKLLTHLAIREDAHVLYGFMTAAEREMFRMLVNNVSGIGPKIALNILSGMNVIALRGAVANGDVKSLSQISGVGKKTAERIVVELKDKIGAAGAWEAMSAQRTLSEGDQKINDAVLALMALGFKQVEAHDLDPRGAGAAGREGVSGGPGAGEFEKGSVMARTAAKSSAVVVPHKPKWFQRVAAWLIYAIDSGAGGDAALHLDGSFWILCRTAAECGDLLHLAQSAGVMHDHLLRLYQKTQPLFGDSGDGERKQGRWVFVRHPGMF